MEYQVIKPSEVDQNVFSAVGSQWMLVSAYDKDKDVPVKYNAMTASWGGMGVWNKNIFWCVIRPPRYTKEFIENSDYITLTFFDEKYKPALNLCGTKSGRDFDKLKEAKLTPVIGQYGEVDYEEATLTFVGKKLYASDIKEEFFIDKEFMDAVYPKKDFHKVYVCKIVEIRKK